MNLHEEDESFYLLILHINDKWTCDDDIKNTINNISAKDQCVVYLFIFEV